MYNASKLAAPKSHEAEGNSQNIEPEVGLEKLPQDTLEKIAEFLPINNIDTLSDVSKALRKIAKNILEDPERLQSYLRERLSNPATMNEYSKWNDRDKQSSLRSFISSHVLQGKEPRIPLEKSGDPILLKSLLDEGALGSEALLQILANPMSTARGTMLPASITQRLQEGFRNDPTFRPQVSSLLEVSEQGTYRLTQEGGRWNIDARHAAFNVSSKLLPYFLPKIQSHPNVSADVVNRVALLPNIQTSRLNQILADERLRTETLLELAKKPNIQESLLMMSLSRAANEEVFSRLAEHDKSSPHVLANVALFASRAETLQSVAQHPHVKEAGLWELANNDQADGETLGLVLMNKESCTEDVILRVAEHHNSTSKVLDEALSSGETTERKTLTAVRHSSADVDVLRKAFTRGPLSTAVLRELAVHDCADLPLLGDVIKQEEADSRTLLRAALNIQKNHTKADLSVVEDVLRKITVHPKANAQVWDALANDGRVKPFVDHIRQIRNKRPRDLSIRKEGPDRKKQRTQDFGR